MILLLLGGAPRDLSHPDWREKIADPVTLRLLGAVLMGVGVYWWFVLHVHQEKRRRKR